MWTKRPCLWLSISFFLASTGHGQQYNTRGGRVVPFDQEKVKTGVSTDTISQERYHADDRKTWTNDAKRMDNKGEGKTDSQFFARMSRPSTNNAESRGREIQEVTELHRKDCNGMRKIVQCKDDTPEETCKQELVDSGVDIVSNMKGTTFFAICVQTLEEIAAISKLTLVEAIEDDPPRTPSYIPGSTVVRNLQVDVQVFPYGVRLVKAPEFWDAYGSRGAGIKVCVIDSGVRATHEDLAGATITATEGFVSPWYDDGYAHGTHVTGTIAARDNGVGVVGVAPEVSIHVVRIYDDDGNSYASALVEALFACYDAEADIINMSLGGPIASSVERSVARALRNEGVLMVAASGNGGDDYNFVEYPAAYEDVLSVGAVDDQMRIAEFSSYNIFVDVVAPGVEVLSLDSDSDTIYTFKNGTSMAAPHVSGVAALLWSRFPYIGVDTLQTAIIESAKDIGACGYDYVYGSGMIDVMGAAAFLANITAAAPELESCIDVQVNVTTDGWGNETTILITREGRPKDIYYRSGPYSYDRPATFSIDFPLKDGCYDLILRDYFGDGILNEPEDPVITITYEGEEQVNDNNFTGVEKVYTFGNCNRRSLSWAPV